MKSELHNHIIVPGLLGSRLPDQQSGRRRYRRLGKYLGGQRERQRHH